MAIPQQILDALGAVQSDDDTRLQAQADADGKAAALLQAEADKQAADAALATAVAHEATDVKALQDLITQVYGAGA